MTRRRFRTTATVIAAMGILSSQTGCAALVVGYLVGDHMQRSKNTENCRVNMRTVNEARIAKGEQPFPDTCGQ